MPLDSLSFLVKRFAKGGRGAYLLGFVEVVLVVVVIEVVEGTEDVKDDDDEEVMTGSPSASTQYDLFTTKFAQDLATEGFYQVPLAP